MKTAHELTTEQRLERMERALDWLQADVALAVRGLQTLLQIHGINGGLKAAFERWEQSIDERSDRFGADEITSPSVHPPTMPSPGPDAE